MTLITNLVVQSLVSHFVVAVLSCPTLIRFSSIRFRGTECRTFIALLLTSMSNKLYKFPDVRIFLHHYIIRSIMGSRP